MVLLWHNSFKRYKCSTKEAQYSCGVTVAQKDLQRRGITVVPQLQRDSCMIVAELQIKQLPVCLLRLLHLVNKETVKL